MLVVAVLTVRDAEREAFRRYEHAAARIMARHGGAIERALVLAGEPGTFRELHVVRFPDAAAFEAYRADAELLALASERARCVVATEVWPADDGPAYGTSG